MNLATALNPKNWFRARAKSNDMSGSALIRASSTYGPWDAMLNVFVPHKVNPYFYESLRAAVPLIDGGINKLVLIDGLIRFAGNDQVLCDEITAAMKELPVNDMEQGIQSLYQLQGNEMYEQGLGMAELVMDARGRKLVGVRVADSKGLLARRDDQGNIGWWYRAPRWQIERRFDGTDQVEVVLRNNFRQGLTLPVIEQLNYAPLDSSRLIYSAFHPEADNPYGVSVMRSMEFCAQNLLRIQNATGNVWDRYGDPPFQLIYKTKNRSLKEQDLTKRRNELATNLATVLDAKRKGNSADFVQAIGADDDIQINVIGAKGEVLQIESPAMHFVEQILAKMPLPGWMVGLTEAQAGRMADQQSEIVLMESKTRFENRLPALNAVVTTWLRSEGIAWKPGDWAIVQDLPNLRDIMKQAQARFLNAQADMMQHTLTDNPQTPTGVTAAMGGDPNSAKFSRIVVRNKSDGSVETEFFPRARAPRVHVHSKGGGENADDESEPWAEDDDTLPGLEAAAVDGTLALWDTFRESALRTLGVTENAGDGAARFRFDAATMLQPLLDDEQAFIDAAGAENGPLIRNAFAAFLRGVENAASDLDVESTLDNARDTLRADLVARDLRLVKDGSVRAFHDGVLEGLQSGIYDGKNPATVADELAQRFDAGNYNWTRLARSEIAAAQGAGKAAQFKALGVQQVDFMTAGGACPICQDLEDGGPYDIDQAPKPVDDSHPQCRCTLVAVVSEKRLRAIQQKSTRRTTNPEKGADLG